MQLHLVEYLVQVYMSTTWYEGEGHLSKQLLLDICAGTT